MNNSPSQIPKLYQIEECPHCHRVRKALNDAGQKYMAVPVPRDKKERQALKKATGQDGVPFLVDRKNNFSEGDTAKILAFIKKQYPAQEKFGASAEAVEDMRFEVLKGLINIDHQLDQC